MPPPRKKRRTSSKPGAVFSASTASGSVASEHLQDLGPVDDGAGPRAQDYRDATPVVQERCAESEGAAGGEAVAQVWAWAGEGKQGPNREDDGPRETNGSNGFNRESEAAHGSIVDGVYEAGFASNGAMSENDQKDQSQAGTNGHADSMEKSEQASGVNVAAGGREETLVEGSEEEQEAETLETKKARERRERIWAEFQEEYYDIVEQLPLEIDRNFTLIQEFESIMQGCTQAVHVNLKTWTSIVNPKPRPVDTARQVVVSDATVGETQPDQADAPVEDKPAGSPAPSDVPSAPRLEKQDQLVASEPGVRWDLHCDAAISPSLSAPTVEDSRRTTADTAVPEDDEVAVAAQLLALSQAGTPVKPTPTALGAAFVRISDDASPKFGGASDEKAGQRAQPMEQFDHVPVDAAEVHSDVHANAVAAATRAGEEYGGQPLMDNPAVLANKSEQGTGVDAAVAVAGTKPCDEGEGAREARARKLLLGVAERIGRACKVGQDKVALATTVYELVDRHINRLDADILKYEDIQIPGLRSETLSSAGAPSDPCLLAQAPNERRRSGLPTLRDSSVRLPPPAPEATTAEASRSLSPDKLPGSAGSNGASTFAAAAAAGLAGRKGKKHKKVPKARAVPHPELLLPRGTSLAGALGGLVVDPNEPKYCYCDQVSFGTMVGCDNDECEREWFHLGCAGLASEPKGKWYCRDCAAKMGKKRKY